ncbi:pilus assembly protein TadG-related protein [Myceligenerans indicum]|uniref:Pilus assembly protein n=1 Tax=Myceligenerans indicum TaxID=2593663 RepID=A0ABS1LGX6_9MICO|nr:pilus assembly protein TadG-related protein [Myceligenerans indicum]MBL0884852.1 pilus assembly protein [Myceligenerans indicum]
MARDRISPPATELGSISSWLITGAFVMILGVGIAVDLTGQVHTQTRANDVASQAARAGGQQLAGSVAIRGGAPQIDASQAAQAARAYLASAGVTGTVMVRGDVVVVETTDTYQTKFLSLIGLNTMTATGHGESRSIRAVDGTEQ